MTPPPPPLTAQGFTCGRPTRATLSPRRSSIPWPRSWWEYLPAVQAGRCFPTPRPPADGGRRGKQLLCHQRHRRHPLEQIQYQGRPHHQSIKTASPVTMAEPGKPIPAARTALPSSPATTAVTSPNTIAATCFAPVGPIPSAPPCSTTSMLAPTFGSNLLNPTRRPRGIGKASSATPTSQLAI